MLDILFEVLLCVDPQSQSANIFTQIKCLRLGHPLRVLQRSRLAVYL